MTKQQVLNLIYTALRRLDSAQISDVTTESNGDEVILTSDDGESRQTWVISLDGIRETDPPED